MKNVRLKSLELRNFKGISNLKIEFSQPETFIHGANRSGKTTVFDAFNWLLFNKNSSNETAFEIKTLNSDGSVKHRLEHEVTGVIEFENRTLTLRKVLCEKWTKKRGADAEELTGNEIKYFIDDVPKSLAEYKATIDLIIQESIARTITDPFYFNTVMPWMQRRELLFKIVGIKSDMELLNAIELDDKQILIDILNQDKTLDDYKKQIKVQKQRFNDEIKTIPPRIDEVQRSIVDGVDVSEIESKINELQKAKSDVQLLIDNEAEAQKSIQDEIIKANGLKFELGQKIQNEKQRLQLESGKEKQSLLDEQRKLIAEKNLTDESVFQMENKIKSIENEIKILDDELSDLRILFTEFESAKFTFDETECKCGACGRAYEETTIEETKAKALSAFNENKTNTLEGVRNKGIDRKNKNSKLQAELENIKRLLETELPKIKQYKSMLSEIELKINNTTDTVVGESDELKSLQAQLNSVVVPEMGDQNAELHNKRTAIESTIKEFESKLSFIESNKKAEARVQELKDQLLILNQEKAQLEKTELLIDKFTFLKITNLENEVNSLFGMVKFKMFDQQLNGGIAECCICTVDGVPFSDANTASKVNAGLDVIKTLQNYFEVCAPIFIDNRESVTELNSSINMQIINLVVDPTKEKLTLIENK